MAGFGRGRGGGVTGLLLSAVLAATPITLEQARQEARNNLQALLSELDRVRASEQSRVATSAVLPQLQVFTSANRTWTQAGDPRVLSNGQILPGTSGAANFFTLQATLNQLVFDLSTRRSEEHTSELQSLRH